MEKLVLSVTEAAKMLGVGRNTMYEMVRTEQIASVRLGSRILIPTHALRTLVGAPLDEPSGSGDVPQGPGQAAAVSLNLEGTYVVTIRRANPGEITTTA